MIGHAFIHFVGTFFWHVGVLHRVLFIFVGGLANCTLEHFSWYSSMVHRLEFAILASGGNNMVYMDHDLNTKEKIVWMDQRFIIFLQKGKVVRDSNMINHVMELIDI